MFPYSLLRLLFIKRPDRSAELKPGMRYRVTLDFAKLRPYVKSPTGQAATDGDVRNWLMRIGLTPTGADNVWKAEELKLRSIPKPALTKAEALR